MSGVSPGGVAENGTRSGKESFDLLFMVLVFTNLLPCLPLLAAGLVPVGHHYYEGSDSSTERITGLRRCWGLPAYLDWTSEPTNLRSVPGLQQHYCHFARLSLTRYLVRLPCEPSHRPSAAADRLSRHRWADAWDQGFASC